MATFGTLNEFSGIDSDWISYNERCTFYFIANKITDDDIKRAVFLSIVGDKTYQLIRGLLAPRELSDVKYDDMIRTMTNHYNPTKSAIVEGFKFNKCNRKPSQAISAYVAELKELSRTCAFGVTADGVTLTSQLILDENLRDRFVCGLEDAIIQRRLLSEDNLSYEKAVKIANAMELASAGSTQLSGQQPPSVNKLFNPKPQPPKHQQKNRKPNVMKKQNKKPCYRCLDDKHSHSDCPFMKSECYTCGKKGHISKACRSKKSASDQKPTVYELYNISDRKSEPPAIKLDVMMNNTKIIVEVDTGASATLINESTFHQIWPKQKPDVSKADLLRTYTGEKVPLLGTVNTTIKYQDQTTTLPVLIVKGQGPNIIGRDSITALKLKWSSVHQLKGLDIATVLEKHSEVFKDELGCITDVEAKFQIDDSVKPRFLKARPVPYHLRDRVNDELSRLEREGILERVDSSDWACPIVPIVKTNGKIRICGDYRATVNTATKTDQYPILEYSTLNGGQVFSKIDCSNAYLQYRLHVDYRKYTTINTPIGLFQYIRLPFGVSSAPAIYQRVMDNMLKSIPGVCVYLDDVLISGSTEQEHLDRLNRVLALMAERGFRAAKEKCAFQQCEVSYLGHMIDKNGLHPLKNKVEAIVNAPAPTNTTELKSFLGMCQFYSKFLSNLATVIKPMTKLLKKHVVFQWGTAQQTAFNKAK